MYHLFPYRKLNKPLSAFGLIEVCLALVIFRFVLSMSLRLTQSQIYKIRSNEHHQAARLIREHLLAFAKTHKKLPCPSQAPSSHVGIAQTACATEKVLSGILPFKTIGLTMISPEKIQQYAYFVVGAKTQSQTLPHTLTHPSRPDTFSLPSASSDRARILVFEKDSGQNIIDGHTQKIVALVIPKGISYHQTIDSAGTLIISIKQTDLKDCVIILEQDLCI